MSMTGYFEKTSSGRETDWQREQRLRQLNTTADWQNLRFTQPPAQSLEIYARSEDYDPVLRAHCRHPDS